MAQAYVLYDSDSEKTALKLYDCEPLTVESKTSNTYTCTIQDALCAPPNLSHIIKIDEKNFAGFDLENFTLQSNNSSLSEKSDFADGIKISVSHSL